MEPRVPGIFYKRYYALHDYLSSWLLLYIGSQVIPPSVAKINASAQEFILYSLSRHTLYKIKMLYPNIADRRQSVSSCPFFKKTARRSSRGCLALNLQGQGWGPETSPVTWQCPNDPRWDPELHWFLEIFFVSAVMSYS